PARTSSVAPGVTRPIAAAGGGQSPVRSVPKRRDALVATVAHPPLATDSDVVTATRAAPRVTARLSTSSGWTAAAIAAVVAVFALLVAWAIDSGAIHRPYSDDWAYLRIAQRFVTAGTIDGVGWNDTSLLGQLLTSKILSPITGSSIAGLRVVSM